MFTKNKQLPLFRASSITSTLHICHTPTLILFSQIIPHVLSIAIFYTEYEACPENKDAVVLNMYNIFNLQYRHCG